MCITSATTIAGTTAAAGHTASISIVTSAAGINTNSIGKISRFTGRAKNCNAVKVHRHRQRHRQLHHARNHHELHRSDRESHAPRKNTPRDHAIPGTLQPFCHGPHHHAKLRHSRSELDVHGHQLQVAHRGRVRMNRSLQQRRRHAGNCNHRQQRHLQARVEQAVRAHHQQTQRGKSNRVQWASLAIDQPTQQIKRHHPQRALHRRGKSGEQRIGKRRHDSQNGRRHARHPQPPGDPEDARGHNRQVEP
jgi:hypothetical protein